MMTAEQAALCQSRRLAREVNETTQRLIRLTGAVESWWPDLKAALQERAERRPTEQPLANRCILEIERAMANIAELGT